MFCQKIYSNKFHKIYWKALANFVKFFRTAFMQTVASDQSSVILSFTFPCIQVTFTCSKSTIETLEKGVEYVQSKQ